MKPQTVDDYIASAPQEAQTYGKKIRSLIKKAAPGAQEKISYGMPYYGYKGRLIYWGLFKDHLGLYVMGAAREALAKEIEPYHTSKATLHFKFDKPLPEELITKIVKAQYTANNSK